MMTPTLLVIFGAGASFDSLEPGRWDKDWFVNSAHRPGDFQPPLAGSLFDDRYNFGQIMDRFPQCRALIGRLRDAIRRGTPVEGELDSIQTEANDRDDARLQQQLAALRFYLQYAVAECADRWAAIANGVTNYLRLLERLERWRIAKGVAVLLVTFNYDTLLEQACSDALSWNIRSIEDYVRHSECALIKPHGSVNWGRPVRVIDDEFTTALGGHGAEEAIQYLIENGHRWASAPQDPTYTWMEAPSPILADVQRGEEHLVLPSIAVPLREKAYFECAAQHLRILEERLRSVDRALIIGWRGAEEHFSRRLNGKVPMTMPVQVVSMGEGGETVTNLRDGFGLKGPFGLFEEGFSSFLGPDCQLLDAFLTVAEPTWTGGGWA